MVVSIAGFVAAWWVIWRVVTYVCTTLVFEICYYNVDVFFSGSIVTFSSVSILPRCRIR